MASIPRLATQVNPRPEGRITRKRDNGLIELPPGKTKKARTMNPPTAIPSDDSIHPQRGDGGTWLPPLRDLLPPINPFDLPIPHQKSSRPDGGVQLPPLQLPPPRHAFPARRMVFNYHLPFRDLINLTAESGPFLRTRGGPFDAPSPEQDNSIVGLLAVSSLPESFLSQSPI